MRNKIMLLGLATLVLFPLIGFLLAQISGPISFIDFLTLEAINPIAIGYGIEFGIIYAFLGYLLMNARIFDSVSSRIDKLIGSMKLKIWQGLFLSLCAGVGEELLFRAGVQPFLGVVITSVLFIALHGYLNPFNWRFSLYGIIALPFILILSYGYVYFGLYFAIAAHFSYDAVLFTFIIRQNDQ
jgi:membrane protease YdiL (CAAX protease family)